MLVMNCVPTLHNLEFWVHTDITLIPLIYLEGVLPRWC